MPNDGTTGQEPAPSTDTTTNGTADTGAAPPAEGGDRRPPWERTGEPFDPERAWALIERLRTERDTARRPPAGTSTTPPAKPTEPAAAPAIEVQAQLDAMRTELTRERVARRFGLDDDLIELLGTGDEDAITARAKTLADRLAAPAAKGSPVPRRPVEQLRGGADPTTAPDESDPAKLAAQIRRGF